MELKFYGASGCVTGSCHILKVNNKNILLDCGMFQGKAEKERGNDSFNFNPKDIDYVILSHAHIDHSGRIPLLYKQGFKGKVYCTIATLDLCSVMLPDSGHIQENEAEWKNRKRERKGLKEIEPIYTAEIAQKSLSLFVPAPYDEIISLFPGFKFRFRDAGHVLGSAITEIFIIENNNKEIKLVYTGDLGNKNIPIIRDPELIDKADYLIMETTYGNRYHTDINVEFKELVTVIKDTFRRGGNVIIPSFAVGRTQEILYAIGKYVKNDELKNLKVFVDSPLASQSTKIFEKYKDMYDEEAKKILFSGTDPLKFEGLYFTSSPEESQELNKIQSGVIIISASGMCDAGRIKHHLKHNLWRPECSIVFSGYQAVGTLGRTILDGAKTVKLFGEEVAVNAKLINFQGLSGHADRKGLIDWLESFSKKPEQIFLVHGDSDAQESFKALLDEKDYKATIMKLNDVFTINEGSTKLSNDINVAPKGYLKESIYKLVNEIDDVEHMDKEELLERIKKLIYK